MARGNSPIPQRVAVLVDGGFFLKRYTVTFGAGQGAGLIVAGHSAQVVAQKMWWMDMRHVRNDHPYRILYYDCPPLDRKFQQPVTKKTVDLKNSPLALWKLEFLQQLKRRRKVAIRLGHIQCYGEWVIKPSLTKKIISGQTAPSSITASDVRLDMRQKGVDIKIGLDIASLAYKRLVDKIVLVSGDSDFVPAAKLARREGIDFILDPMWNPIQPDLFEHIDGLQSHAPKPASKGTGATPPSVP